MTPMVVVTRSHIYKIMFITIGALIVGLTSIFVNGQVIRMDRHPIFGEVASVPVVRLRFASYYADNMVLQQAPQRAVIWGFVDLDDPSSPVSVYLLHEPKGHDKSKVSVYKAEIKYSASTGQTTWSAKLAAMKHGGPHVVRVTYGDMHIEIRNVLFGDVWLCSGQSNMQFGVSAMFGASQEIEEAKNYPDIRLFDASMIKSSIPLVDLQSVALQWSLPTNDSLANGTWTYFSAVCWLFGKNLHKQLGYPIGLVESCWGGTPIEAWSSPSALHRCGIARDASWSHSVLWNAMIRPLLNMTIYGAIWYQGEANSGFPDTYNCTFPALIEDWREQFHAGSQSETAEMFPFGFVQLGPSRNEGQTVIAGFPDIRWHQTADVGYVPNPRLPAVFMAVAMDDKDPTSPFGSIHPRDKRMVGERLSLAGLAVAYGRKDVVFQGPIPTHYSLHEDEASMQITYDGGNANITLKQASGFEISGAAWWQPAAASVQAGRRSRVLLRWQGCAGSERVAGMRYAWRESPCAYRHCAVYAAQLPAPPYVACENFRPDGRLHGIRRRP